MNEKLTRIFLIASIFVCSASSFAQTLSNISVSLSDPTYGEQATYTFQFTLENFLPSDGKIAFTFPSKYDSTNLFAANFRTPAPTTASGFNSPDITDNGNDTFTAVFERDGFGAQLTPPIVVEIVIGMIGNPIDPAISDIITIDINENDDTPIASGQVTPIIYGPIVSFDLSDPINVAAGNAFALQVSNAVDYNGNPADGIVTVEASAGGGAAPDGTQPVFQDIVVTNGIGTANQTLYKAESGVQLRGNLSPSNTITDVTNPFVVDPGALGNLTLGGLPGSTVSGSTFTSAVTVNAFDSYSNPKTNYSGTIQFTSSDASALLPADYTFPGTSDQSTFLGNDFTLITPVQQTITVRDVSAGVSNTSDQITVNALVIDEISTSVTSVSQGQNDVVVQMTVNNLGNTVFNISQAELRFRDGASASRDADYVVSRTDGITSVAAGLSSILQFAVDVQNNAQVGNIEIDGIVTGDFASQNVNVASASTTDNWNVQIQAEIVVNSISISADTLDQGQTSIPIQSTLANNQGETNPVANANIISTNLVFLDSDDFVVSDKFSVSSDPGNPSSVSGGSFSAFDYNITVAEDAPTGKIRVSQRVSYSDANIDLLNPVYESAILDSFICRQAAVIELAALTPSQTTVTVSQTSLWSVQMDITNSGNSPLVVNFDPNSTYIRFSKNGTDKTSQFTIDQPSTLDGGGNTINPGQTKSITYNTQQNGTETGTFTITGRVESNNGFYDTSVRNNVFASIDIQEPDDVSIVSVLPSQTTVTRGDMTHPWTVSVVLENSGGSDVEIDFNNTALIYSNPMGFTENVQNSLVRFGDTLPAGETDTLKVTITQTGTVIGQTFIDADVRYSVVNTGENKNVVTNNAASVQIQEPADFVIESVRASQAFVTNGANPSNWRVTVVVSNENGGADVELNLTSNDSSWIRLYQGAIPQPSFEFDRPSSLSASGDLVLRAGTKDSLIFNSTQMGSATGDFTIHSRVSAREINRDRYVSKSTVDEGGFSTVTVQTPADLSYATNTLFPQSIATGSYVEFQVEIENTGGSTVELDPLQTVFRLSDGILIYTTTLNESFATSIPGSGTTTIQFQGNTISENFNTGSFSPSITLKGLENGTSFQKEIILINPVIVGDPGELSINYVEPKGEAITAGQTKPWTIKIGLISNGSSSLKFDSTRVTFFLDSQDVTDQFTFELPQTLASGSDILNPNSSDTLIVNVSEVSPSTPAGRINIFPNVYMTDTQQTTRHLQAQAGPGNSPYVIVQETASLSVAKLRPGQETVTRGQQEQWVVAAYLQNNGGSDLLLDLDPSDTFLQFSTGNENFTVLQPVALNGSGDAILRANSQDSLLFVIDQVSSSTAILGSNTIHMKVTAEELNTGTIVAVETDTTGIQAIVTVENPAQLRIDGLIADVTLGTFVNTNQQYYLKANLANIANGELVEQVTLEFVSEDGSTFPNGSTIFVDSIAANSSKWSEPGILVQAPAVAGIDNYRVRVIDSKSKNTGQPVEVLQSQAATDTTLAMQVQYPGSFEIDTVHTSIDTIPTGTVNPWYINVVVSNPGTGQILIDIPEADDISFNKQGYVVVSDQIISEDGLILKGGDVDTLVYKVTTTSPQSGDVTITAAVGATDRNDPSNTFLETGKAHIFVTTSAVVLVNKTYVDPGVFNVDESGVASINTNQQFQIKVAVSNNGGQDIDSVRVRLNAVNSQILNPEVVVKDIKIGLGKDAVFNVIANAAENSSGETFTATIVQAFGIDGSNARIDPAVDADVLVKIQKPAIIQIVDTWFSGPSAENFVSYNQVFPVGVAVQNNGTEAIKNVQLSIASIPGTLASIAVPVVGFQDIIASGQRDTLYFNVQAGDEAGTVELKSTIAQAIGANNNQNLTPLDPGENDVTTVSIEQGAQLQVVEVFTSIDEINAGDSKKDWRINAVVKNTGQADLEFIDVTQENITFTVGGQVDSDYQIRPPTVLTQSNDLILRGGGVQDTLVYVISKNGEIAGEAQIDVDLSAFDRNKGVESTSLSASGSDTILVISTARVKIVATTIPNARKDATGAFLVNKDQSFVVRVAVETGERSGVDSVKIELSSDGQSLSEPVTKIIDNIPEDSSVETEFNIVADSDWSDQIGNKSEIFTAQILSAKAQSTDLLAQITEPNENDALAKARIQVPTKLDLALQLVTDSDSTLTAGQEFDVVARITNLGTSATGAGFIKLEPPEGYGLKITEGISYDPLEKQFELDLDENFMDIDFTLISPTVNSFDDTIRAVISEIPNDLNSQLPALVENDSTYLTVTTVSTDLAVIRFEISEPEGAKDGELSTFQNFKIKAEVQASPNLSNIRATLTLPNLPLVDAEDNYILIGNNEIQLDEAHLVGGAYQAIWSLIAPKVVLENHSFIVSVTGKDAEGDKLDARELEILKIVRGAELELESLIVSDPVSAMQDDRAVFSKGQEATLRTRVVNKGDADISGSGKVKLELFNSGLTLQGEESFEKEFVLGNVVEWDIIAPNEVKAEQPISISITQLPDDENTNTSVPLRNSPNELNVRTDDIGIVNIDTVRISDPLGARDDTVSTGQSFTVYAEISSERVQDNFKAQIRFANNLLRAVVRDQNVDQGPSVQVIWEVLAPEDIGSLLESDSVWVEVTAFDKQSGLQITDTSKRIPVLIEPRTTFSISPKISYPADLIDRVSTDQEFHLTAVINHGGAPYADTDSFTVRLLRPNTDTDKEYSILEGDNVQTTKGNPIWRLKAPSVEPEQISTFSFEFIQWPKDANSGQLAEIDGNMWTFPLRTLKKTELAVRAFLNQVDGPAEGSVRVGNLFDVIAKFDNFGSAQFEGTYRMAIELPNGFTKMQPDTLSTSEESLKWKILAPTNVLTEADTIKVSLVEAPIDQYAKEPAFVQDSTAYVLVKTEAGMVIANSYTVKANSAVTTGGIGIPVLGIELKNQDNSVESRSVLKGLELILKDKAGELLSPGTILSRIAAVEHSDHSHILGELLGSDLSLSDRMSLDFDSFTPDTIVGIEADSIDIIVDISSNAKDLQFQVCIDSANAFKIYDVVTNNRLVIGDKDGNPVEFLQFSSGISVVFDQNLEKIFSNYPNPFGSSSRAETNFVYYLKQDSDVDIKIFTLTGDLVTSWSFLKSDNAQQTKPGIHEGDIRWDGRNGQGAMVMNGVYLAYITTGYGESAMTKIAVVK